MFDIDVDIQEVKRFAEDKLSDFLVANTTDFGTAAFILQAVFDKIKEVENSEK